MSKPDSTLRQWITLVESGSPTDYDVQRKYAHFNKLLFDGKLPTIPITWKDWKKSSGHVDAKVILDPTKPKPNPMMVRLGLEDKYSNRNLDYDSLHMFLSPLYKRSEEALDGILVHEMIHVWCFINRIFGEAHGSQFLAQLNRCQKIVGFDIPLKDQVGDLELAEPMKAKPFGVVIVERNQGFLYAMTTEALLMKNIEAFKDQFSHHGQMGHNVTFYVVADELWTQKSLKTTIQRKPRLSLYIGKDPALLADIKQNGRVIATL